MALTDLDVKKTYTVADNTKEFPIPFQYFLQGDVKVIKTYGSYATAQFDDSDINGSYEIVFDTNHPFATGQEIRLATSGAAFPVNTAASTSYYVINVSATRIKLAATKQDAIDGTFILIANPVQVPEGTITVTAQVKDVVLDLTSGFTLTTPLRTIHPTEAIALPTVVRLEDVHDLQSGESLTIIRDIDSDNGQKIGDIKQSTELSTFGEGKQVEAAIDRNTAHMQELQEGVDRAIKIPVSYDEDVDLNLPAPEADTFIGWDNAGEKLINRAGTGTDPNAVHVAGENTADEFSQVPTTQIEAQDRLLFEDSNDGLNKKYATVENLTNAIGAAVVGEKGIDVNTVANQIKISQLHTTGTDSPPTIVPDYKGAIYVNETLGEVWIAAGTDSPADWKKSATAASNTLELLSDTTITSPKENQLLAYDATLNKWVNRNNVKVGEYRTDGEYSTSDPFASGMVENVYPYSVGAVHKAIVTFKQGTFFNQLPYISGVVANDIDAQRYSSGNIGEFWVKNETSVYFTDTQFKIAGIDEEDAYTKADGEVFGTEKNMVLNVPFFNITTFGYDRLGDTHVAVWSDTLTTHSIWFSISKDGYTYASKYYRGTQGALTSFGHNSATNASADLYTLYRPQVKIVDANTAYVMNVAFDNTHVWLCWKIDLSQANPIDHITLLSYDPLARNSILRNSGTEPAGGTHVYGNPQLQHDPITNITVLACQADNNVGKINATSDDVNWVNDGGKIIKDNFGGAPVNINWSQNGNTQVMTAYSKLFNLNATDARFVLIYTVNAASGAATGQDLMYASCDITANASPTPPTITFNDAIKIVRQSATTTSEEILVGALQKNIGGAKKLFLLSVSNSNTLYQKLNLVTCEDISTQTQNNASFQDADILGSQITMTGHPFQTAEVVQITSTGTHPTGFNLSTDYFVRVIDSNTIQLHSTKDDARANLLPISPTGNDSNANHFFTNPQKVAFIDKGDISNYFNGVGPSVGPRYNRFGQSNTETPGKQLNEILHTQIFYPDTGATSDNRTLLVLHPINLKADNNSDLYSYALVIIPDYQKIGTTADDYAPIMQYIRPGTSNNEGLDMNAWQGINMYMEPQFMQSDDGKLFIVYKNVQTFSNNLAYGSYSSVEIDLTNIASRNLVGWNTSTGQDQETQYFNTSFANMNSASTYLTFDPTVSVGTGSVTTQITRGTHFTNKTCRMITPSVNNEAILKINVTGITTDQKVKISGIWMCTSHYIATANPKYTFKIYAEDSTNTTLTGLSSNLTGLYPDAVHGGVSVPACVIDSNEARYHNYSTNVIDNWEPFELVVTATDTEVNFYLEVPAQSLSSTVYLTGLSITVNDLELKNTQTQISNNTRYGNPEDTTLGNYFLKASQDGKSFAYTSDSNLGTTLSRVCIDHYNAKT